MEKTTKHIYPYVKMATMSLLFFFVAFYNKLVPISVVIVLITWIFPLNQLRYNTKIQKILWPTIVLYLIYVVGLLYTENKSSGLFDLEVKLSLLILPLFVIFVPTIKKKQAILFFVAFGIGLVLNTIFSFFHGYQCYQETGWIECFYYSRLSYCFHPTYFSMYINAFIIVAMYIILYHHNTINKKYKILLWVTTIYLTCFAVLLASKGGLLTITITYIFFFILLFLKLRKMKFLIIGGSVIITTILVLLMVSHRTLVRFESAISAYRLSEKELFNKYRETVESSPVRRMIWICSGEIISENPIGVGTGDVEAALMEKYSEKGMTGAYNEKLNAHCQYYQTGIAMGYPALIILLLSMLFPLLLAYKNKDVMLGLFILVIGINMLFESIYEVQAGIVFCSLFISLSVSYSQGKTKNHD